MHVRTSKKRMAVFIFSLENNLPLILKVNHTHLMNLLLK